MAEETLASTQMIVGELADVCDCVNDRRRWLERHASKNWRAILKRSRAMSRRLY